MGVLDVDGGAEPPGVPGDVVGEDDGAHRRLARAGLAHQQNLLLHGDARVFFAEYNPREPRGQRWDSLGEGRSSRRVVRSRDEEGRELLSNEWAQLKTAGR